MRDLLRNFWNDKAGATAVEYGLIAMMIFLAIITVVGAIGSNLNSTFTSVNSGFSH